MLTSDLGRPRFSSYIKSVTLLTFIALENPQYLLLHKNMVTNICLLNSGYCKTVTIYDFEIYICSFQACNA